MNREIYLDNNATTQPLPEVREAMMAVLGEAFGNPSSAHSAGDRAREQMIAAREATANLIGADPDKVWFTSSGTEANNTVFNAVFISCSRERKPIRIVTTQIEHSSIVKMCEHLIEGECDIVYVPVDRSGAVDYEVLEAEVNSETDLVSIQWVNNETGVIQPIEKIGELCAERDVLFHTDAAQAVGKLVGRVSEMPIDLLTLTGHKFHGPQGVGALYARDRGNIFPLLWGGSQENGLRPGTENVPGIVGMGVAAQLRTERFEKIQAQLVALRDQFERGILSEVPDVEINGDPSCRVSNTTNLLFRDVDGQALTARLDQVGIRCSQSSACTNQRPEPSYVLRAMGLSETEAYASIRFSVSELNTVEEIDFAVDQIKTLCEQLRSFRRRRQKQMIEV